MKVCETSLCVCACEKEELRSPLSPSQANIYRCEQWIYSVCVFLYLLLCVVICDMHLSVRSR